MPSEPAGNRSEQAVPRTSLGISNYSALSALCRARHRAHRPMNHSGSRVASQSPARSAPISHHPSLHRVRHHVSHRCSGNRAPPAALAPAPVQGQLRTPAGITPRTASCIAVHTVAAHTPRRLRRASCARGYSPSLISQINAIRTPFGASFITPDAPWALSAHACPCVPSWRLSGSFLPSAMMGICRTDCVTTNYL